MKPKPKKKIPFDFVLDELARLNPEVKPMFGAYGIYAHGKIVLILREKPTFPEDNGIWVATIGEHHASLRQDFPSLRSIKMFGPGETGWQVLPVEDDSFEILAMKLCKLVLKNDIRVGKVPKTKAKKKKKINT